MVLYANGRAAGLRNQCLRVRISPALLNIETNFMSLECDGYARDPAKVEDQVRLLAWTLRERETL